MKDPRWGQIKELFASALEREPSERREFLCEACAGDEGLRIEIEALLAVHESNLTSENVFTGDLRGRDSDIAGQRIGPYRVLRMIGTGGMGTVYLATRADQTYHKQVAIKLVRSGVDTEEVLRRFRHERQILANLDHPNIAKLLDGGSTEQGSPYFVMDYVEGTRIDEYCSAHQLPIKERIRLFRDVCSAVQYVHQNLVVHRDLKPSNMLVTTDGVAKLLDFGIAKILKPELMASPIDATIAEFRALTPGYASPEQVRGEPVTTASDVYSLGVILYELLTSRRAYRVKTDSPAELLQAVCEQDPDKPSLAVGNGSSGQQQHVPESGASDRGIPIEKLRKQLSGDVDNIVLKALRKEPQRRYASVEQLSDDLRRHLGGLPVSAHRDTWNYRTGKFIRRHKAGVAAAALLAFSLVGGILATTWQARVARTERAKAQQQFNDVRKLTTSFLFEFYQAIQTLPGATPARKLLVQRALEYLSKLAGEAHGDVGLQRDLAEAYLKVGDVQGNPYVPNLGDTEGAVHSYSTALQISQALTQANGTDTKAQRYLARSYKSLGEVLPLVGKPSDGIADLHNASELYESLSRVNPEDTDLKAELANCYQALGDLQGHSGLQNLGDKAGALESYNKSLESYEALLAQNAGNQTARRGTAVLKMRIGDLKAAQDDSKGAMKDYQGALVVLEGIATDTPNNADSQRLLAIAYQKIGGEQEDLGNAKEALNEYQKAANINESLVKADPTNSQANGALAITLRYTGDLLAKTGDRNGALTCYQRVLQILDRQVAAEPTNVLLKGRYSEMLVFTADLLFKIGQVDEARRMTEQGLAITRELAGRKDATPDDLYQYAETFLTCTPTDLREPATALEYAEKAVEKSGGTGSDYLEQLAQAYFANGDSTHAVQAAEQALKLLPPADAHGPASPTRRRIEAQLVRYKTSQKQR